VTATGGTPAYTYAWSPTGGNSAIATNLSAGNYTVTVTDANGCTATATISITQPPPIALNTSFVQATCGQVNGSATVTASGGTPSYTYVWSSGGNTPTATNLSAGNYTVTVTDANGCTATTSVIVTNASGPAATISASANVLCNGGNSGSATVTATGGTPAYTYAWSPTGGNSVAANNLSAGNYTVTVTDANGCTATATISITQPPPVMLNTSFVQATCGQANGSATVTASGGTPSYTYVWSSGGNAATESNLSAGNYTVTVTDANGCTATTSVIVTNASGPTATISASANVLCNGGSSGSATVTATGGTPSYTYAWSSGGNTPTVTNLSAGNYTVTVTDANGCTATATVSITQPPPIALNTSFVQATCGQANGSATVTASGGTPSYTYAWSSGGNTATESNLSAGNYTVTVTDANGCTGTASIVVSGTSAVIASITATPQTTTIDQPSISFFDNSIGATGWAWNFGDGSQGSIATNTIHTFTDTGSYYVCLVASDQYGCSDTACITININGTEFEIYIPNVFTPNHDGVNDIFTASGIGIKEFELIIYDRWGLNIFHTNDIHKGWNGLLPNGQAALVDVYVYLIRAMDPQGVNHKYVGSVSVIR
jgi:gliding motility-associated-like protein